MHTTARPIVIIAAVLALAGCSNSSGGGSGSSTHASTVAATTSGSTSSPGSTTATGTASSGTSAPATSGTSTATPTGPLDYSGIWEVSGTDAARGAYAGTAAVVASGSTYTIERLVTFQQKLGSGRDLVVAWNMTATGDPAGLHLHASLRRAHVVKRLGSLTRSNADRQPLAVDGDLAPANGSLAQVTNGTALSGAFTAAGLTETWVRSSTAQAPLFPVADVTQVPLHAPPSSKVRSFLWNIFAGYRTLPAIAPYVNRADFQAAIHSVPVDHTCRDFYRQNKNTVVVLDSVSDEIAVFEESLRAQAFSNLLHEKAAGFDADMEANHIDPSGMIMSRGHSVSGDGALHTGCWVAAEAYRYMATGDTKALDNVRTGVRGLITLVDICPDKTQFARAVQDLAHAPSNWTPGTGAYANLAWLPRGNNDMLHGIDYGFLAAEQVLPAGDPLRARMGAQARSLLDNVSIAQSGTHEIMLASVAWKTTQDPAVQQRYQKALQGNLKDRVWTQLGSGITSYQGIGDWSGHHLGACTYAALRILGGSSPDPDEQGWRQVAIDGITAAFNDDAPAREGMVVTVAAAAVGAAGAADEAKDILGEVPFPKPVGDADIERDVSDEYCVSPYPSDPWKGDWMTNPGRVQALTGLPIFYHGTDENYWARGPLETGGSVVQDVPTSQDYLHAYWLGRATGVIGPND